MKPGGHRIKGKAFELEIAHRLEGIFPDARRRAMQARGGREGADLDKTPGFWIEAGHGKRMDPVKKWRQAQADSQALKSDDWPVAITKRDHGEILVTMRLEEWIKLVTIAAKELS